jgi:FkbM family methyltransferase
MNFIRLLKNIPLRFNEERSEQLAKNYADGWRRVFLSRSEFVTCPDDALVNSIWRFHFFSRGGRSELKEFLKYSNGLKTLIDIGASAGIFSALFANTRVNSKIISVEPDLKSYDLLQQTIRLNSTKNPEWNSIRAVMSEHEGFKDFSSSGFGGIISTSVNSERVISHSIKSLVKEVAVNPELIKIDIESWEYEVLISSLDWLAHFKPRIFLELHWRLLEQRNLSPGKLLWNLGKIGYKWRGSEELSKIRMRDDDGSGILRLTLINNC